MIALSNRAWLVAALVLSALLLGAAPRSAGAHDHPPSGESGAALHTDAAPGWSQSCPANPGRTCCCAGVFALAGPGKVTPANSQAWTLAVAPAAGAAKFASSSVPPIAALPLYQARPRAPPISS